MAKRADTGATNTAITLLVLSVDSLLRLAFIALFVRTLYTGQSQSTEAGNFTVVRRLKRRLPWAVSQNRCSRDQITGVIDVELRCRPPGCSQLRQEG